MDRVNSFGVPRLVKFYLYNDHSGYWCGLDSKGRDVWHRVMNCGRAFVSLEDAMPEAVRLRKSGFSVSFIRRELY